MYEEEYITDEQRKDLQDIFDQFDKDKEFMIFDYWGLGIGDWGLGIGDWGLGPIPNPQSPIL